MEGCRLGGPDRCSLSLATLPPCLSLQGLSPEYDTARARLDQLQAQAGAALEGIRGGLRERGAAAAALKRVKLVDYRGEQLLQVG